MKKRVLLISESMGGGLRKHVVQLIQNLDREKYDIYFIHGTTTLDDAFLDEYKKLEEYATIIPCKTFSREIIFKDDWNTYKFISQQIDEIKPDIVHCHSSKAGALGRIAAKRKGIKKIFYTPHAYSFLAPEFSSLRKVIYGLVEKFLSRYATTKTFNVSQGEKEAALKIRVDRENKFEVIYNGLPQVNLPDKFEVRKKLSISEDSIIIGNNARMTEQKNPLLFMNIAKKTIEQNYKYHFVWAGDGPLFEKANNYIKKNGLEKNIHLLGDRKDSEFIVSGYDIFLITSLYEGLPYAPIEAMRAGVPILATDVVGNNEVVFDGKNGYLFYDNINFFLEKVKKLKRTDIQFVFKKNFSIDNMVQKLVKNYEN